LDGSFRPKLVLRRPILWSPERTFVSLDGPRLCALLGHPCAANDDREADAARLVGTTQQSFATRPIFAPGLTRVPSTLVLPWRGIAPLIAHGVATVGRFWSAMYF